MGGIDLALGLLFRLNCSLGSSIPRRDLGSGEPGMDPCLYEKADSFVWYITLGSMPSWGKEWYLVTFLGILAPSSGYASVKKRSILNKYIQSLLKRIALPVLEPKIINSVSSKFSLKINIYSSTSWHLLITHLCTIYSLTHRIPIANLCFVSSY